MTNSEEPNSRFLEKTESQSEAFLKRVATLQNKVNEIGHASLLTESELKAFMDDQWGEDDNYERC